MSKLEELSIPSHASATGAGGVTPHVTESTGAPETPEPPAFNYADELPELVIAPKRGWIAVDWAEMWRGRELLLFLIWRDVKVRYKQTVLGVAWAVLQPVLTTVIFVLIFGKAAGFADDIPGPYALFVYTGLLAWMFFSNAVSLGSLSLMNQQHLLTKVYFPRLFIPTGNVGGAVVDMGVSTLVFGVILLIYRFVPSWQIVFLPLLMLLCVVTALGVTYTLAALTVSYRDFRFLIPFMMQIWMYLSPTFYIADKTFPKYAPLLYLNPLVGIIDGYRAAALGMPWNFASLGVSIVVSAGMFLFGLFYFRKTERRFADIA